MIESALVAILEADSAVAALVATRVYPHRLPQDTELPAIAYQEYAASTYQSHEGPAPVGERYFDVRCWGVNYTAARALADAVRKALNCYVGTIAGEDVQVALITGGYDLDHSDPEHPESREACRVVEVKFWYTEAT